MGNVIILGAQWGDEGKGKIVDLLSERFDIVARYQGGHNAGHTVFIGDRKFVLKLIPSGILRPGKMAVIGNGLVIDPAALIAEIGALESAGVRVQGNLSISNRAHVLFPAHRMMEKMSEARPGRVSIGTTSRGIGPCYEDKAGRRGIRIADLLDTAFFRAQYDSVMEEKAAIARTLGIYGTVIIQATVNKRGEVTDANVVSGNPILAAAAKEAVLRSRYQPGTLNGQPIEVPVEIQIAFTGGNK